MNEIQKISNQLLQLQMEKRLQASNQLMLILANMIADAYYDAGNRGLLARGDDIFWNAPLEYFTAANKIAAVTAYMETLPATERSEWIMDALDYTNKDIMGLALKSPGESGQELQNALYRLAGDKLPESDEWQEAEQMARHRIDDDAINAQSA